jgi:hypothetical protein
MARKNDVPHKDPYHRDNIGGISSVMHVMC